MEPVVTTAFTPWLSLLGGVLIGISAVMVMGMFGKIAGITGITKGLVATLPPAGGPDDRAWRIAFLAGLILSPLLVFMATGSYPKATIPPSLIGMAVAGLLVGIGTSLGSGCTSGHGVCGIARLSRRSFAAVASFLATAVITTTVLRHFF